MFLFSYLLVVYCRPAMLLLHGGAFVMLYFPFCMLDIGKMMQKIHFFVPKICTYQKKVVPLQRN